MKAKGCEYNSPEFCDGDDLRRVFPKVHGTKNIFSTSERTWCHGCRGLNQGGFKYVRPGDLVQPDLSRSPGRSS